MEIALVGATEGQPLSFLTAEADASRTSSSVFRNTKSPTMAGYSEVNLAYSGTPRVTTTIDALARRHAGAQFDVVKLDVQACLARLASRLIDACMHPDVSDAGACTHGV